MISIREVEAADHDQWKPMYEGYLIYYETEPEEQQMQSVWQRLLDDNSGIFGLVAEDNVGTLFGMTHYLFHANVKFENPVCYLQDLYTTPDARSRGIGRALIEDVYKRAVEYGAEQTYWMTQEFNYAGRMLYDKVGEKTPFIKYSKTK